ncbi:MAG: helix-turn-helix transcriptional regulator [Clostridia bacterium]|nr:helix-turn-helix transcriptional regulator [Clostridia bacterium]
MNLFENIVITEVEKPATVFLPKGITNHVDARPTYGVSFCLSGQVTYVSNGQNFTLDKNCAVILPQGAEYTLRCQKEGQFPVINFKAENFKCDSFITVPLDSPEIYINNYEKLSDYFLYDHKSLKIFSLFYSMLDMLKRSLSHTETPLYPVVSYLEKNISDNEITNEFLAQKLGISEVYLRKLFHEHYGVSPKQYIIDMRIQKARQLLENGTLTITEISEQCGISSLYHFCRLFKAKVGLTPSDYRKNNMLFKI